MAHYSESNIIELTNVLEKIIPEISHKFPKETDLDLLKPHMEQAEINHSIFEDSHMKDKHLVPIILPDIEKEVPEPEKEEPIINKNEDSQQIDDFGLVNQVKEKSRKKEKEQKEQKKEG